MKPFRTPDLNAPRYRSKSLDILNKEFYDDFRKEFPKYAYLTNRQIREIIRDVNGKIWETAVEERDGIELPEQLGCIFIASCPPQKKSNVNYKLSKEMQHHIQHRNWESDQFLAKIFYTNWGNKYRFLFSNLWGFAAVRQFSRTVAKVYPEQYKKYVVLDNIKHINNLFRKYSYRMKMEQEEAVSLEHYDEFDLD